MLEPWQEAEIYYDKLESKEEARGELIEGYRGTHSDIFIPEEKAYDFAKYRLLHMEHQMSNKETKKGLTEDFLDIAFMTIRENLNNEIIEFLLGYITEEDLTDWYYSGNWHHCELRELDIEDEYNRDLTKGERQCLEL